MRCAVCGQEYGVTHVCAGVAPAAEEPAPPQVGSAPLHYFLQALRIARWDDAAVRRASRDAKALPYGILIWAIGVFLIFSGAVLQLTASGRRVDPVGFVFGLIYGLTLSGVLTLAQFGIVHLIAKQFFGGRGTFVALLRPLLLGQIVTWLFVIPVAGPIVAGLAGIAVLMICFEEVEGITRMQAFGTSAAVGAVFWILRFALMPAR